MNRLSTLAAVIAVLAAGLLFSLGRRTRSAHPGPQSGNSDSVWYHTSDVALMANTGRPQLVEFFHPS